MIEPDMLMMKYIEFKIARGLEIYKTLHWDATQHIFSLLYMPFSIHCVTAAWSQCMPSSVINSSYWISHSTTYMRPFVTVLNLFLSISLALMISILLHVRSARALNKPKHQIIQKGWLHNQRTRAPKAERHLPQWVQNAGEGEFHTTHKI